VDEFDGLKTIDGIMKFKSAKEEVICCDKCGIIFCTSKKYRFYCDDCYLIIRMQEEIKARNWSDNEVKKKWNQEAKASRLSIISRYGKPCPPSEGTIIVKTVLE